LPTFFLDCKYDKNDKEETDAFIASFKNTLITATVKKPYYPQGATAARPLNIKLEEEKKELEEKKVSLEKLAKENEEKARKNDEIARN
jgi:hypothetical protein